MVTHGVRLRVKQPGFREITTQLYFRGGDYVENDEATAVKPELILDPTPGESGLDEGTYNFARDKS